MNRGRNSTRLSLRHRRAVYLSGIAVWLSGLVWLCYRYIAHPIVTDLGPSPHPAQAVWLKIHGAAAMVALIVVGTLLAIHVPAGWRQRRSRLSGSVLLTGVAILTITGWGLYYFGSEQLRQLTSTIHWTLGLVAPLALVVHLRGRTRTKADPEGSSQRRSRTFRRRVRSREVRH